MPHQSGRIPAGQMGGYKDAVGQHIGVKIPHAEAGRHDLHRLLDAEHLAAVFKQRLPGVHNQLQRPVKDVLSHEYSPALR